MKIVSRLHRGYGEIALGCIEFVVELYWVCAEVLANHIPSPHLSNLSSGAQLSKHGKCNSSSFPQCIRTDYRPRGRRKGNERIECVVLAL